MSKAGTLPETLPQGYQMTELGPLPEEWRVVRLGEVFDIQQGKSLSPKSRSGPRMRPFLRTANVFWGRIDLTSVDEMHFNESEEKRLVLKPGDLLVCEGGDIGRTAMWEGQLPLCLYQNHLYRLRTQRKDTFPLFYMYWMQVAWTLLALYGGSGNKTTIPNLSRSRLAKFLIPLPPLCEQRAIAHVLQAVQQAKEATDQVIAAARELKKSLMRHLFTYGPVPVDAAHRIPMQETELGPLPKEWQVVRLGEVAIVKSGGSAPQGEIYFLGGKHPFVRVQHLDVDTDQVQHWDLITDQAVQRYRLQKFPAGTIVFPKSGASIRLEKRAILPVDSYIVSHLCAVLPKSDLIEWMFLFYSLKAKRLSEDKADGYPVLNLSEIREVSIPLPPFSEQREIARMLEAVDEKIRAEEARRQALEALFKSLLHDLMTARRRLPRDFVARFAESSAGAPRRRRAPTTKPSPKGQTP